VVPKPPRPALNLRHPLARGLVGAWPFWTREPNPGGNLLDRSTGAGTTGSISWAAGAPGAVLSCVGTNETDRCVVGGSLPANPDTSTPKPFALWALCKPADTRASNKVYTVLSRCGGNYPGSAGLGGLLDWNGTYSLFSLIRRSYAGQYEGYTPIGSCPAGVWYSVVANCNASGATIYVNGVAPAMAQYGALNGGINVSATMKWVVGGGEYEAGTYSYSFGGEIADARAWNRELTKAEADDLYVDPWGLYRRPHLPVRSSATSFSPWLPTVLHRRQAR